MDVKNDNQLIGFGVSIVNRYSRHFFLHAKDTILGIIWTLMHFKTSPLLNYRHKAHLFAEEAFKSGYRLFDTARIYGYSEYELGKMLKKHNRGDVFVCTKVSDMDLSRSGGSRTVRGNLQNSLKDLGTDYVDLYLLHWPSGDWIEMYKQMNELYKEGLAKNIGVCNFKIKDFEALSKVDGIIQPQFCQIECHPLCMNKEVLEYCSQHNIVVLAHTPTGRMCQDIRNNKVLMDLSQKYGKSIPQILLKWHIQSNRIPIIHSENKEHIVDNANIFDFSLSSEDIKSIDNLNKEQSFFNFVGIDNPNYKYNK